jgi:hypothetical protein
LVVLLVLGSQEYRLALRAGLVFSNDRGLFVLDYSGDIQKFLFVINSGD